VQATKQMALPLPTIVNVTTDSVVELRTHRPPAIAAILGGGSSMSARFKI
jgi:hypothetical protein